MQRKSILLACISLWVCATATIQAEDKMLPEFSHYPATVTSGPFSQTLVLTNEQIKYSAHWKKTMQQQLVKPVNFAGHYRFFATDAYQGDECQHGICGWVLDKSTGNVVSNLPESNGSDSYGAVGDNGTPIGEPFETKTQSDSLLLILTGQAIPKELKHDNDGVPITNPCETNYYKFENNKFIRIFEDRNGCNVD